MKDEQVQKLLEARELLNSAKRSYYQTHFYEFNRDILGWPDLYEPLHRRVCNFIQDNVEHKKILLLLPRGTFKSSVVTVGYALWQIARNPNSRTLIANATYPMAVQFLGQIKNHLSRNENFKQIFGDYSLSADSWREDKIYIEREKSYEQKDPTVWAQGIQSNVTGSHIDVSILDDVVSRENISTKDQIEKVKNFYKDTLDLIDQTPDGHKRVIIVGTTWHFDDLYSWIQDKNTNIAHEFAILKIPAFEGDWDTGKLLFPNKLSWKVLKQLKNNQGNAHFSAQYLMNPIPEEDQTFRPPFKKFETTDLQGMELRNFFCIDPAISESKQADYSAMVCISVDKNNTWYVRDVWRDKVQPQRLIEQIFYWYEKWKPLSVGLETVAYQRMLQYYLIDEMKQRGIFIPLKELKNNELSKEERIRGLQPRYEIGSVLHADKTEVPMIEYLEDELMRFPRAANDDCIDALASNLQLAFAPKAHERRGMVRRNIYPA